MLKYFIGTVAGGIIGFFVIHKLIGCSAGSCRITSNPYISTIYGIILGLLIVGIISLPTKIKNPEQVTESQTSHLNENTQSNVVEYKKITAKEAKARIDSGDDIIIVDVRTIGEYESGYIQGAILIPNETITNKMPVLLPELNTEILIYCRSGNRSAHAAKKLIEIGYTNVYDFGGIINWPYGTITKP